MNTDDPKNGKEQQEDSQDELDLTLYNERPVALGATDVDIQIATAKRFPRQISTVTNGKMVTKGCIDIAIEMATYSQEVAETMTYMKPLNKGKTEWVSGPSVRLMEIMFPVWGNATVEVGIISADRGVVMVKGAAWDMQSNARFIAPVSRRIYKSSMADTVISAAVAIAKRNAFFGIVPKAYVQLILDKAQEKAVGPIKQKAARLEQLLDRLKKAFNVSPERALAAVGCEKRDDITPEQIKILIGLGAACKDHEMRVDQAFPLQQVQTSTAGQGPAKQADTVDAEYADDTLT